MKISENNINTTLTKFLELVKHGHPYKVVSVNEDGSDSDQVMKHLEELQLLNNKPFKEGFGSLAVIFLYCNYMFLMNMSPEEYDSIYEQYK